jgi:hypothetical protein
MVNECVVYGCMGYAVLYGGVWCMVVYGFIAYSVWWRLYCSVQYSVWWHMEHAVWCIVV